jgi:hypothetical protein
MGCCGGPRRSKRGGCTGPNCGKAVSLPVEGGSGMMDSVIVEYIGPKSGGFTHPSPSGRRYRFNPPYRRATQVAREDAPYFGGMPDYRILTGAQLGPAVQRVAPVSEPISVAAFQNRPQPDANARTRAALAAALATKQAEVRPPIKPQIAEQTRGRHEDIVGKSVPIPDPQPQTYTERKKRVQRPRVDENKTPKWAPKGIK